MFVTARLTCISATLPYSANLRWGDDPADVITWIRGTRFTSSQAGSTVGLRNPTARGHGPRSGGDHLRQATSLQDSARCGLRASSTGEGINDDAVPNELFVLSTYSSIPELHLR